MSFCISAIGNDGIIIATESRGNLYDKSNGNPFCYYDMIQKCFTNGKYGIGSTGEGLVNEIFFSKIIDDFFSKNLLYSQGGEIDSFIRYTNTFLQEDIKNSILLNQKLFFGIFINQKPKIGYINIEQNPNINFTDGFICSAPCIFSKSYSINKSCTELAKIATESIEEYGNRGDNYKTIGGPISVLKITNKGTEWIQNPPVEQKYFYFSDFIEGYKNEEIDFNFIKGYDKKYLDKLLGI